MKKPAKYPVIYCPPQLRNRIEFIGNEKGITGITPTLNHIVTNYEKKEFQLPTQEKQKPVRKVYKLKWL